MKPRTILAIAVLLATSPMLLAESLVTVRLGEQDTCKITGVTTITPAADNASGTIRFDLSKLPAGAKVTEARLRMWVDPASRSGKAFGIDRWRRDGAGFAGFNVWQVGGGGDPLDTTYPFAFTGPACHEWLVTVAVKAWLAKPESNQGLRTDFRLPPAGSAPAWQRPYLQVTCAGPNADRPPQPKDLKALYRSGQVFVTWRQIPYEGAFFDSIYRVYASDRPITAANLDKARLLGEVHRNSQLNYRRSAYSHDGMGSYAAYQHFKAILGVKKTKDMTRRMYLDALEAKIPTRYNFVIDDSWTSKTEDGKWLRDGKVLGTGVRELKGPELSDDTGLFVWTVDKPGKVYLAVTSLLEGNENREDLSAGNALAEPVEAKVDAPKPVLQVAFHRMDAGYPHQKRQMLEYVFWGGPAEGLAVEPSTPFYFRINPPGDFVGFGRGEPRWKAWITVEPWWSHGGAPVVLDTVYVPPTRLAPFPPTRVPFTSGGWKQAGQFYYGGRKGQTAPGAAYSGAVGRGNLYGYLDSMNIGKDPRQATARPYFENRALRQLEMFFDLYPKADRDLVLTTGEGCAMMLAVHHPEVFAFTSAAQEEIWTSKRQASQWCLVGMKEWPVKTDKGFSPWDWNDPVWYSKKFPQAVWPFITICQSPNYARGDQTHWGHSGYPQFYLDMAAEKRGGAWWWCDIGDAPNGGFVPTPRNQAYPAFTHCTFCETPRQEWREEPRGTLNGYLVWHNEHMPFKVPTDEKRKPVELALPLNLVDTPETFEIAIRIGDRGRSLNGQSVPPTTARHGATDVTLWRLQQFKVAKGDQVVWANRKVRSGQVLQSGTAVVDDRGLITVPGVFVDRDPTGNRLTIAKGGSPAAVEKDKKVGELTYAQYAKACTDPVLFPPVDGEATFTIAQFGYVRRGNPDGSISFKGGSFSSAYDTIVDVKKPGPYVLTVRAKGEFGGCWPLMSIGVGGKYGRTLAKKFVDTSEYAPYRWYADLPAGKLRIRLNTVGDYYASPALPALRSKVLHVADLTLKRVDPAAAERTAAEIRVMPRRIVAPAGMPIQFAATVLNALGKPMDAKVSWAASAGKIGDDGVFVGQTPGEVIVTAKAAGLAETAPIAVGEALVCDFNQGHGAIRGWTSFDLPAGSGKAVEQRDRGRWTPPPAGHSWLNSLLQHNRSARTGLLYAHGGPWSDQAVQADIFLSPPRRDQPFEIPKGSKLVHGLIVRGRDADNHYRLEIERRGDGSAARLVKRLAGNDTVLAQTDKLSPLAAFDYKTNPMCPGWHQTNDVRAGEMGITRWKMDRMKLQAAGKTIRAWVNGREIFAAPVADGDLPAGSAGLYAEGWHVFDNVEITRPR